MVDRNYFSFRLAESYANYGSILYCVNAVTCGLSVQRTAATLFVIYVARMLSTLATPQDYGYNVLL